MSPDQDPKPSTKNGRSLRKEVTMIESVRRPAKL
jgi:hypothetical protein